MIKGLREKGLLLKKASQKLFKNEIEFLLPDKSKNFPSKKYAMMKRNQLIHRDDVVSKVEVIEVGEEISILKDLQYIKSFKEAPMMLIYKGEHLRNSVEAYLVDVSTKRNKKVFKYIITRY